MVTQGLTASCALYVWFAAIFMTRRAAQQAKMTPAKKSAATAEATTQLTTEAAQFTRSLSLASIIA